MKIYTEKSLANFDFWSGAKSNADMLSVEQLEQVEAILEDCYPEGVDETTVNDLFWFDFETVLDWLGLALNDDGEIIDPTEVEEEEEEEEEE